MVLEQWDFSRPRSEIASVIEEVCRRYVMQDCPRVKDDVTGDLTALFEGFLSSEPYKSLQRATILGREVPFVMPLDKGQMMEGVIDVIYRLDGRIWIADYKTDMVSAAAARARADHYRSQGDNYSHAVANSLGLSSVSFQFIFLRPGVAIEV
jgi:ATP-dependent helicase/nuclease subunit A